MKKLKWTKAKERAFNAIKSVDLPSGGSCTFIEIGTVGLKLYKDKANCDRSFERQRRAARHGLAPQVGDKVKIPFRWREDDFYIARMMFGYLTQLAVDVGEVELYFECELNYNLGYVEEKVYQLGKALKKIGLDPYDLHDNNVGRMGHKIVCIDFDDGSMPEAKRKWPK